MKNLETKSIGFKIKAKDEVGTFSAYGNTFGNVDLAGDMTMKGAFTKCIQGWAAKARQPRLLSQHGHRANPIGIITSMKEDENGLLFEGKFCTEAGTAGAEAYALVKMGALDMFSIGYNTIKQKMVAGVNELHELDVKEISLVTFACNENSLIQSVKSALIDNENPLRGVQKALQAAGISKRQAQSAVESIKATQNEEKDKLDIVEASKAKALTFETKFIDVDNDGEMSIYDYQRTICTAIKESLGTSDDKWIYIEELYMDKAIVCVCEYNDDEYKEYYVRVNYTVSYAGLPEMDVMVGKSTEVVRVVKWMTEEEVTNMQTPTTEGEKDLTPPPPIMDDVKTEDEVPEAEEATDKTTVTEEKSSINLEDIKSLFS